MIFQLLSLNAIILSSARLELKKEKQDFEKQVPILKSDIEALKTEMRNWKKHHVKEKVGSVIYKRPFKKNYNCPRKICTTKLNET